MLARLTLLPVATDSSSSELTLYGEMGGPLG